MTWPQSEENSRWINLLKKQIKCETTHLTLVVYLAVLPHLETGLASANFVVRGVRSLKSPLIILLHDSTHFLVGLVLSQTLGRVSFCLMMSTS